ncbi:hypothetical protein WICPIJ_009666 [Wickerhamomyces pijperi]|uniref:Sugar phosphate transporter domain-containing protein n=1 Tax=Wickerhamomyces pijperi TaxID=599730 RepID=A0A9P8PLJ4_WICPI|nr:hypothetical protein WICPIJ_009666 [Wickerhamomyces pijperi]
MITVQLNNPLHTETKTFNLKQNMNNITEFLNTGGSGNSGTFTKPQFKPSKSSADLTSQDYNRYFTLEGRQQYSFQKRFINYLPEIDFKVLMACLVWYFTSAISSNLTKEVLKQFKHPITLTECQFLISSIICISTIAFVNNNPKLASSFPSGTLPTITKFQSSFDLIKPNRALMMTTLPMGIFQFIGHITSHKATSVIPVSIVHSIKALSPLTTVVFYKIFFKINYPLVTYITLIPLIVGVMMTCFSNKHNNNKTSEGFNSGVFFAFISMIIFVSQNLFAKKILTWVPKTLPTSSRADSHGNDTYQPPKFDKISILLYCSVFGFLLTLPVYIISEFTNDSFSILEINFSIIMLLLIHGISHFIQAMLAFYLIGEISTVNYSIANIMKRIVVISMALVWERQSVNGYQGLGLICTLIGLYCYDKWGMKRCKN